MTDLPIIPFAQGEATLNWLGLTRALTAGHDLPKASIGDTFLYRDPDTLLSRSAWIDGMGLAVKSATVFPGNARHGMPSINGAVTLFSDRDGTLEALIDFHLVTKWKTAGDSLLAALHLARAGSREILIVGAGTVAASLIDAFSAGFPDARFAVWSRTAANAQRLAQGHDRVRAVQDLESAVRAADIILCATMSREPLIAGAWLQPGQHLNLIGAYRPDMREIDDMAMQRARIYVDSFDTTIGHIGEIEIPLSRGVIARDDLLADFYNLPEFARTTDADITVFKNGGGAHLDLMTSRYILDRWRAR
ncbi:MAG: ornithine cyclodeaminase [Rhodobacteraceae bacterium]|nr:ornithine cyclodeaminase [Paracoccaceae bacterium]